MNIKKFQFLISVILVCASTIFAQENKKTQNDFYIAIIDVGSKESSDSFSQFLWINIAETPNIVLVEREQINKILEEQALNLQFGDDSDTEHFVKAGKILGADFLLMFESGKPVQEQVPIRFRLVETRYGMKFWDYGLLLDKEEKNHQAQAKAISETIISRLQTKNKYGNLTYVGIGAFRSEELSQNWNWISDELAVGIEQKLVNQPSIVLLERRRIRPLMNERDLVEGLPETLRSSAVFIDGSYRIDRQKNANSISVTFYGYSNNQKVFTINIEGSSDNIRELFQKASIAITEKLNIKHETVTMDPAKEAALLVKQAESFIAFKDYRRAVVLYETTLAIDPNNIDAIRAINDYVMYSDDVWGSLGRKGEDRERFKRETIPLLLNTIAKVKYIAENYPAIKDEYKNDKYKKNVLAWISATRVFSYPSLVFQNLGNHEDTLEILKMFQAPLSDIFPILVEAAEKESESYYAQVFWMNITYGYWWSYSPQEYLNNVYKWLELSISKEPMLWYQSLRYYSYDFSNCPLWADRMNNTEIYRAFLDKLFEHPSPLIRACANQAFVEYYIDIDKDKALLYYKNFIETIVNEVIPNFPDWGYAMHVWDRNLHDKIKKIDSSELVVKSQARIVLQVLRYSDKFEMGFWKSELLLCCRDLERIGESQQAGLILTTCRDKIEKLHPYNKRAIESINTSLRDFKERNPKIQIDVPLIQTIDIKPFNVLNNKQFMELFGISYLAGSDNKCLKLLIDENSIAVICLYSVSKTKYCGIIWFDPETLTIRDHQEYEFSEKLSKDFDFWYSINLSTNLISAICNDSVYVSFPDYGIIVFSEKDKPRLLSEENGLPSNTIVSMDAMNKLLYVIAGNSQANGLVEIDPNTFQSRILISSRIRENSHPLDGTKISTVIADRWNSRLWISVSKSKSFFYFDPVSLLNTPVQIDVEDFYAHTVKFQRQGHFLNIKQLHSIYNIDLITEKINLVAQYGISYGPRREDVLWQTDLYLDNFAVNTDSMIFTAKYNERYHTLIFNPNEPDPKLIAGMSSNQNSLANIKEYGRIEKGFLILTKDSLYLLPNSEKRMK